MIILISTRCFKKNIFVVKALRTQIIQKVLLEPIAQAFNLHQPLSVKKRI